LPDVTAEGLLQEKKSNSDTVKKVCLIIPITIYLVNLRTGFNGNSIARLLAISHFFNHNKNNLSYFNKRKLAIQKIVISGHISFLPIKKGMAIEKGTFFFVF